MTIGWYSSGLCLFLLGVVVIVDCALASSPTANMSLDVSEQFEVTPLGGPACDLGEGPHWQPNKSTVYYVDAFAGYIHRYQAKEKKHSKVNLGDLVTIVIPIEGSDQLLVSLRNKVVRLDFENETYNVIAEVAPEKKGKERFNDGKIDPLGRLWIGTVLDGDNGVVTGGGSLYKLENGQFIKMSDNFTISNGMAWNKNRTKMYFNDSEGRKTYTFDYDVTNGTISNKKILIDYSQHTDLYGAGEYPDGMAIDSDDQVWIALYGGARIIKINPETGALLASVKVPAPQSTSLAFGGENLSELYVTTGNGNVKDNAELQLKYPNAGQLFKVTSKSSQLTLKGVTPFDYKL